MDQANFDFVRLVTKYFNITEPIFEFGSRIIPGQENYSNLRSLFPGKQFIGYDIEPGPGVDQIADIHKTNLPNKSAGMVISLNTFEHIQDPFKAIGELNRILCPGGLCLISSVMNMPIHDFPHDYWRFTPDGFKYLLRDFSSIFVGQAGQAEFPKVVIGLGIKQPNISFDGIFPEYKKWQQHYRWPETWQEKIMLFAPVILVEWYRSWRGFNPSRQ